MAHSEAPATWTPGEVIREVEANGSAEIAGEWFKSADAKAHLEKASAAR